MNTTTQPTFTATIYMAGDISVAKQAIREDCMREGLCVTVMPCDYIYTAGQESGFAVGLLNYPRFPSAPEAILERAKWLLRLLMDRCCQRSGLIVTPTETLWFTREANSTPEA